jgi:hypothetical protein
MPHAHDVLDTLTHAQLLERYACGLLYVLDVDDTARLPLSSNGIADSMLMLLTEWGQDYRQCVEPFLRCLQTYGSPVLLNQHHTSFGGGRGAIRYRDLPPDWETHWKVYSATWRNSDPCVLSASKQK